MTDLPEPDFTPAPSRRRIAGWTSERQAAFVGALARGHTVGDAAAGVGLSARSAYHLREGPGAAGFAAAWDAALDVGSKRLEETALDRALGGERRTVFYRGKAIGEHVRHDTRLLLLLLKRRRLRGQIMGAAR